MPCPIPTSIILVARVARSNLGILLNVTESILKLVLKNVSSKAISLKE
jgi:hypothetical protein